MTANNEPEGLLQPETDEQKRVSIAEAVGLTVLDIPFVPSKTEVGRDTVFTEAASEQWKLAYPGGSSVRHVPDYLGSLEAMHEAEEKLNKEQRETYIRALHFHETGAKFRSTWEADWLILHATARQRAEAFLKTIRKP